MKKKTSLPHNCHIGKVSVFPKDWDKASASLDSDWRIQYRFYDPEYADKYPKGYLKIVKGFNHLHTLQERRAEVKNVRHTEMLLLKDGFNPITKQFTTIPERKDVYETTPFLEALEYARQKSSVVHATKLNMKSQLKYLKQAAAKLEYQYLEIKEIRMRHLKRLFERLAEIRPSWGSSMHNKYLTNLRTLFWILVDEEVIDGNPAKDIRKKEEIYEVRDTLTPTARKMVAGHLERKGQYRFLLYCKIFFHQGMRETESLRIKCKDVNLAEQLVKVTILKGARTKVVYKTIKNIAVPLWREAIKNGHPEDYVFSEDLLPGPKMIATKNITRRWHMHIKADPVYGSDGQALPGKGGLGLDVDFYAFKHGNTTEMKDVSGDELPAELNSHSTTGMVRKIYDTKRNVRYHEELKAAANEF